MSRDRALPSREAEPLLAWRWASRWGLALLVPCLALLRMPGDETAWTQTHPYGVAPFGTVGMVVAHVIATISVAWLLASYVRGILGTPRPAGLVGLCIVAGGCLALVTLYQGDRIRELADGATSGELLALRVIWVLLLQLPWCLLGQFAIAGGARERGAITTSSDNRRSRWPALVVAGLAALFVPAVYAHHLEGRAAGRAGNYVAQAQFAKAREMVVLLRWWGSRQIVADSPLVRLQASLEKRLVQYLSDVRKPLNDDATEEQVVDRANKLVALNALDDAVAVLEPISGNGVKASLVLAAVYEEQGRVRHDRELFALAVAKLEDAARLLSSSKEPSAAGIRRQIYMRWAQNLRMLARYSEAEDLLSDASREFTEDQAFFVFELGRHYHLGGRFYEALKHYELAANSNPAFVEPARAAIRDLSVDTPACFLRPAMPASE